MGDTAVNRDSADRAIVPVVSVGTMSEQAGGQRVPDAVMQREGDTWTFHLTVIAKQEGDQWTAWCPELDIAAQGDTLQQAAEELRQSITAYITHMVKNG